MTQPPVTAGELAAAAQADFSGDGLALVTDVVYDSRQVSKGALFAALRGADLDGHTYVASAVERGASALLVEQPFEIDIPQLVVPNSRQALAGVAAAFFRHPSREVGVIGVTGTDGKTTTSFILDHVLRTAGAVTGLIGTVAVRIGHTEDLHAARQTTPESSDVQRYLRQMVDAGVDWATLEATSHGLAMFRLDHVEFRVGAVTNITHEHLDYHGTVENYRRAKAMLLERVAARGGLVVSNADDAGARAIEGYAGGATLLRYSLDDRPADVRADNLILAGDGSYFTLATREFGIAGVRFPLIGAFNVANALCAAATALGLGVPLATVVQGLESAPPVPGRMARVDAGQPFSVIVDYAHTPDSLEKILRLLRSLHPGGRLIAVFGSAGERDREKRPIQGSVAARLADVVIITTEDPRFEDADTIIEEIVAGARESGQIDETDLHMRIERQDAVDLAISLAEPGDCVLLAGKGHEGSIIWGREKRPWNEAEAARRALRQRGFGGDAD
ncbi:MAG: UDP-N-acetylmuramoyl-L-alanyl-D-glutamate--2,6-diaminopimelate ligase [Thermomicrobiales bacterium]